MKPVAVAADSFSTTPPSPSLEIPASSTLPCRARCPRACDFALCIFLRQRASKRTKSHLDWIVVRRERSIGFRPVGSALSAISADNNLGVEQHLLRGLHTNFPSQASLSSLCLLRCF